MQYSTLPCNFLNHTIFSLRNPLFESQVGNCSSVAQPKLEMVVSIIYRLELTTIVRLNITKYRSLFDFDL